MILTNCTGNVALVALQVSGGRMSGKDMPCCRNGPQMLAVGRYKHKASLIVDTHGQRAGREKPPLLRNGIKLLAGKVRKQAGHAFPAANGLPQGMRASRNQNAAVHRKSDGVIASTSNIRNGGPVFGAAAPILGISADKHTAVTKQDGKVGPTHFHTANARYRSGKRKVSGSTARCAKGSVLHQSHNGIRTSREGHNPRPITGIALAATVGTGIKDTAVMRNGRAEFRAASDDSLSGSNALLKTAKLYRLIMMIHRIPPPRSGRALYTNAG